MVSSRNVGSVASSVEATTSPGHLVVLAGEELLAAGQDVDRTVVDGAVADDHVAGQDVAAVRPRTAVVEDGTGCVARDEMLGSGRGVDHPDARAQRDQGHVPRADEAVEPGTVPQLAHGSHPMQQVLQLRFHRHHDADWGDI